MSCRQQNQKQILIAPGQTLGAAIRKLGLAPAALRGNMISKKMSETQGPHTVEVRDTGGEGMEIV